MKTTLLAFLLLFSASVLHGQPNLVLNPSFEDTLMCPRTFNADIFMARHWTGLDTTWNIDSMISTQNRWIPDLEHSCGNGFAGGCPNNPFFYQYPRTGNSMVELVLYSAPPPHSNSFTSRAGLSTRLPQEPAIALRFI